MRNPAYAGVAKAPDKNMYYVYILRSAIMGRYYVGHTNNLQSRLGRHNDGLVTSTKHGGPWTIIHTEKYKTKPEAMRRELEIKKYKGGILFKRLIGLWKE